MRAALVSICLVVALGLAACSGQDADPSAGDAEPTPTPTSSVPDPSASGQADADPTPAADPEYVVQRIRVGNAPCGILGAGGQVWVSNYTDDNLVRVDPATGEVSEPIPTGDSPCGLAFGAGSIWVENYGSDDVTRVNARTGEVQGTFPVGSQPYDVTFADGAAWTSDFSGGTVSRIDAGTGKVTSVKVGGQPIGLAPADGAVWVGLNYDGIAAIDSVTRKIRLRVRSKEVATWTAYTSRGLWLDVGDHVVRIDPATGEVRARVRVGDRPNDGTVVGGEVWVGDKGGKLYHFPVAAGGGAADAVDSGVANPFVVAGLDGILWVADFAGTDVVAIDPARTP